MEFDRLARIARLRRKLGHKNPVVEKILQEELGGIPEVDVVPGRAQQEFDRLCQKFDASPTAENLVSLIEAAFLLDRLPSLRGFYRSLTESVDWALLHPRVRSVLILELWQKPEPALEQGLMTRRWRSGWQDLELLFIHQRLFQNQSGSESYLFFVEHESSICSAVKSFGGALGINAHTLYLRMLKLAALAGLKQDFELWFQKLPVDSVEYREACQIQLLHRSTLMEGFQSFDERIKFLDQTLSEISGMEHPNILRCNAELATLLHHIPRQVAAWRRAAQLLVEHVNKAPFIRSYFTFPRLLEASDEAGPLTTAFWRPILTSQAFPAYWKGVAIVQLSAVGSLVSLAQLFKARSWVSESKPGSVQRWAELALWLERRLGQLPASDERERLAVYLRVLRRFPRGHAEDLEALMAGGGQVADWPVVQKIFDMNPDLVTSNPLLTLRCLRYFSSHTSLRNSDLSALIVISAGKGGSDLAWRAATILKARRSLVSEVENAWEFSGESRKFDIVPAVNIDPGPILDLGSSPTTKFLRSYLGLAKIGPSKTSWFRRDSAVHKVLKTWFSRGLFSDALESKPGLLPGSRVAISNDWSDVLNQTWIFLGFAAWQADEEKLRHLLAALAASSGPPEVVRRQKLLCGGILASIKGLSKEELADSCLQVSCRLATMMMPNNFMALETIQKSRLPLPVLRQFENWLIGESYGNYRRKMRLRTRVAMHQIETGSAVRYSSV